MEHLWSPWRYGYITGQNDSAAPRETRKGVPAELRAWPGDHDCVFCNLVAATDHAIAAGMAGEDAERAALLVARGRGVYVCLNRFPYNSGHVMVAVPRWGGDTSFFTTLGETRTLPEALPETWRRLRKAFAEQG